MIVAAVDGSSLSNPGPAGWAWYIDDDNWEAGGWPSGTNNKGELQAVLSLLRATKPVADEPLKVLCDSQYVINSVTRWMPGWKRRGWRKADGKPVLNQDLLKALDEELRGRDVSFEWVRGHAGHAMNEAADERARAVAMAYQTGGTIDRGPGLQLAGGGSARGKDSAAGSDSAAESGTRSA
ncbi:MAG: ribonuclease H, partial [Brooklawnia sp.]|uniref:ribonuclease H family protein n=1 Tax=Brooklawnia sp. TaxID=2699740 RepID=UPI003C78F358